MTTGVLEKPAVDLEKQEYTEVSKEELCKKLCVSILEGLLEGYEDLKQKNPEKVEKIESKINELKNEAVAMTFPMSQ
jgi:hypothetical protein